jgi:hypothetical protein
MFSGAQFVFVQLAAAAAPLPSVARCPLLINSINVYSFWPNIYVNKFPLTLRGRQNILIHVNPGCFVPFRPGNRLSGTLTREEEWDIADRYWREIERGGRNGRIEPRRANVREREGDDTYNVSTMKD